MMHLLYTLLFCLVTTFGYTEEAKTPQAPVIRQEHVPVEDYETMQSEPDNFLSQLMSMALTIAVLVGLIMLLTWVLKRMLNSRIGQINSNSLIKVLETRNISPKTAIHVVDVYGKNYIIAESMNGVTQLGELSEPPPRSEFEKVMQNKKPIS